MFFVRNIKKINDDFNIKGMDKHINDMVKYQN